MIKAATDELLKQVTFRRSWGKTVETSGPSELYSLVAAFGEFNTPDYIEEITEAMDGKEPLPHYMEFDSMEIVIEEDYVLFQEQEDWRHADSIKLTYEQTRELVERFMIVGAQAEVPPSQFYKNLAKD